MIYKIISQSDWVLVQANKELSHPSLELEGFIHFAFYHQLEMVAEKHFKNVENLILICVNEDKITSFYKEEDLSNKGVLFPHVYGKINLSEIKEAFSLERNGNGKIIIPPLEKNKP